MFMNILSGMTIAVVAYRVGASAGCARKDKMISPADAQNLILGPLEASGWQTERACALPVRFVVQSLAVTSTATVCGVPAKRLRRALVVGLVVRAFLVDRAAVELHAGLECLGRDLVRQLPSGLAGRP